MVSQQHEQVSLHTSIPSHSWTEAKLLLLYSINESINVSRSLHSLSLYKRHSSDVAANRGAMFSDGSCLLNFIHDLNVLHESEPTMQSVFFFYFVFFQKVL